MSNVNIGQIVDGTQEVINGIGGILNGVGSIKEHGVNVENIIQTATSVTELIGAIVSAVQKLAADEGVEVPSIEEMQAQLAKLRAFQDLPTCD